MKIKMNKIVIFIVICVFIIVGIFAFLISKKYSNKDYEIEEIVKFSYFKLHENSKYGVIDKQGNVLVTPIYDMLEIPNPSKAVFIGYLNYDSQAQNYETVVLNEKNEKILTNYSNVLPLMFRDALAEVPYEKSVLIYKENGKYGVINFKGEKITKSIYDSIESLTYKEGCLLVEQKGKFGIINIKGEQIVKIEYDIINADGYYEEETKYKKAGFIVGKKQEEGYRYGYISNEGKTILEVEYNQIERITEILSQEGIYLIASKNGQAGVYQNDKQIIKNTYTGIEYNKQNELFILQKNNKQGVFDKQGNQVLKTEYEKISILQGNIVAMKDGVTYYFDKQGKQIETKNLNNNIATANTNYFITIDENDLYGIKNKEGNIIISNEYSYIEYAYKNYFIITKNGNASVYDALNRQEIIKNYNVIQKIEGKNILQAILTNENTTDLYNANMEKVVSMKDATINNELNYMKISSNTERKYFDKDGHEKQNTELLTGNSLYAFTQEGKWGFKEKNGVIKINAIYDMVTEQNSYGFAGIMKDGKWGVINAKGNILVEPSYEIVEGEPEFIGPYVKLNLGYGMVYYTREIPVQNN